MNETGFENLSEKEIRQFIKLSKRVVAAEAARNDLLAFCKFVEPDVNDPDDSDKSMFVEKAHHTVIAQALMKVEQGKCLRLGIAAPPQHGKSNLASRKFLAYFIGRNPHKNIIFATYSDSFAGEFGDDVRAIMKSEAYREVFPDIELRKDTQGYMVTSKGGKVQFIGRGGAGTGKPADLVVIDDPLKNAEEADSPTTRSVLHNWFSKVIYSRATMMTAIVIIQTRWHEDDLLGSLCDPDHPNRVKDAEGKITPEDISNEWTYLNVPAVVTDPKLAEVLGLKLEMPTSSRVLKTFGHKPMSALWPERFSLEHLATAAQLNPHGFSSLYMGEATPEDGDYFTKSDIVEYHSPLDLPSSLAIYGASDHATSEKKKSDFTVVGCIGVDERHHIWVLPDVVMEKMETNRTVNELIGSMQRNKTLLWWMENEHISKSFGPFLREKMIERQVYTPIDPVTAAVDKRVRARAIQGRMQLQTVHFPAFAPWWPEARRQLLKFPYGRHDDFVDFLGLFGQGLLKQIGPVKKSEQETIKTGTFAWVVAAAKQEHQQAQIRNRMR